MELNWSCLSIELVGIHRKLWDGAGLHFNLISKFILGGKGSNETERKRLRLPESRWK